LANSLPEKLADPFRWRSRTVFATWFGATILILAGTFFLSWHLQTDYEARANAQNSRVAMDNLHRTASFLGTSIASHAQDLIPFTEFSILRQTQGMDSYRALHSHVVEFSCATKAATLPYALSSCTGANPALAGISCRVGEPSSSHGLLRLPIQVENSKQGRTCSAVLQFYGLGSDQDVLLSLLDRDQLLASWFHNGWQDMAAPATWSNANTVVPGTPWTMRAFWKEQLSAAEQEFLLRLRLGTALLMSIELMLSILLFFWIYRRDQDRRYHWVQEQLRKSMLADLPLTDLLHQLAQLAVSVLRAKGSFIAQPAGEKRLQVSAVYGRSPTLQEALTALPLSLDENLNPWGRLLPTLAFRRRQRVDRHSPQDKSAWAQARAQFPALREMKRPTVWPLLQGPERPPVGVLEVEATGMQHYILGNQLLRHWDPILAELQVHLQAYCDAQEQQHLLHYDKLTQLPNRMHFLDLAAERLEGNNSYWLTVIDLDHFNEMNTVFGSRSTDACLQAVARKVLAILPKDALFGRIGGDEFAGLIPERFGPEEISKAIAKAVAEAGRETLKATLTCSLGWAQFPEDDLDLGDLFHHANEALAQAKIAGRDVWQLYGGVVRERAQRRLRVHHQFPDAIEKGNIAFFLQGKADMEKQRISGVEMLARWRMDDGNWLGPGKFMSWVEENPRLIRLLGRYALSEAMRLRDKAKQLGLEDWSISLNIGARHFLAPEFIDDLSEICPDGRGLVLELTETAQVLGRRPARPTMESCRKLGYQLSMDDFGTGYSSLLSVARLPFDELKLDQSFIRQFRYDIGSFGIAGAARLLSQLSHIRLLAEGIERPEELRLWQQMGGRYIQGFLIAPPLPEQAFFDWYNDLVPHLLHAKPPMPLQDLGILWQQLQEDQRSKRRRSK